MHKHWGSFGSHCMIYTPFDPKLCVVDKTGKPIPGLFAAGEVAGGVHGANHLGSSSLLCC